MQNRKIGVLMGGFSSEKGISVSTGQAVLAALKERSYQAVGIYVDRDLDLLIRQHEIEVAFLALHGRYGEDGCIQGMLEIMGVPYTGSDLISAALAMHKVKSKELFRLHNIATPPYYVVHARDIEDENFQHHQFGFPVIVKPIAEGSSIGVQVANNQTEWKNACFHALQYDSEVLVEQFIQGQEISVAILEDRALGAIEIQSPRPVYDFASKFNTHDCQYFVPPRVSPARYQGILKIAERAHHSLSCSGATRVDMIVSPSGNEYVLEVNTTPSLTPQSLMPKIVHAAGLDFESFVEAILGGARLSTVDRGNRDRRTKRRTFPCDERREVSEAMH